MGKKQRNQSRTERRDIASKIRQRKKIDIFNIKYSMDFDSKKKLIEIIPKSSLNLLLSNPLPKTLSDLNVAEVYYLDGNLKKEIDWCLLRIYKYRDEINQFISLQKEFEIQLLNGNFDICESILIKIENDICFSYWGLQAKLLIAELNHGTEGNKTLLTQYQKQINSEVLKLILYYNSIKIETDIPSNKYDSQIDFSLKYWSIQPKQLLDYVVYKICPFHNDSNLRFDYILGTDFSLSVIDTYVELKKILSIIISGNDSPINVDYIKDRISDISVLINDNYWKKILSKYSTNQDSSEFREKSFEVALKNLVDNEIIKCLKFIGEELTANPNSYNLYQIFVEALSLSNENIIDFINDDTLLYPILQSLYQVIKKEQNHSENIEYIRKLAYIFEICSFHLPLISLCDSEKYPNVPKTLRSINYFQNKACSLHDAVYLKDLIDFLNLRNKILFIGNKLEVDYFIQKENYKYALKLINSIEPKNACFNNIYYETWHNRKKLHCLIEIEEYSNAAKLVVNYYFKHQRIFTSLYSQKLVDKIVELDGESIYKNINIPILFTIYNLSSSTIYDSIANFLIQNDLNFVSQVIHCSNTKCNVDKLGYFLQNVCTLNNIQDSPYLSTIEIVEKERINVLTQFKELKPQFANTINNEIFDIMQNATVRDCLQNIYDSRIYVDTNGVKNVIFKEIGDFFERYININDFSFQDYSLFIFHQGREGEIYSKLLNYISYFDPPLSVEEYYEVMTLLSESNYNLILPNQIEVPYSRFIAFQEIVEIIKNQFLFNEDYGLKFFLSMRIRHGTLPNFLNNVFDKHNLIINEGINKEKIISYWAEKIADIDQSINQELFIDALKSFTLEIENITNEGVSWVKIKESEYDKQSMFEIEFSENDLYYNFRNRLAHINDFDKFIEEVFDILWVKVNYILNKLKERFNSELLTKYISSVDILHNEIDAIFNEGNFVFFNDVLVSTKTDIQNAVQKSLNWFNISKTKSIGEIPILSVIQTSKEYLNILNANVFQNRIICTENININQNIKGAYFILFCDFFNTILGNVIKHTEATNNAKCEISISENIDGGLTLVFSNNTVKKYTKEQIGQWNKFLNDNNGSYDASFEDKSGFPKLKKLLESDEIFKDHAFQLNWEKNIFTFKVVFFHKKFTI